MMSRDTQTCPGCGLVMPSSDAAPYSGSYNTSPECWGVYTEVLGEEFSNAVLFGQVHQLTVDAYAVQHAGGSHPDKSVDIHLCGLYLILERDTAPTAVSSSHQRLADSVQEWPHFPPPAAQDLPTILEVALADSVEEHIARSRDWATQVWEAWAAHHDAVATLVARHLDGAL